MAASVSARETTVPGGVVDAAGRIAYVQGARGGVDAVEIASGRVVWSDAALQRPVAVVGTRLLVEVPGLGNLRLAVREARANAPPTATSDPLPLPKWALRPSGNRGIFSSRTTVESRELVRYEWSARAGTPGGMHPMPGEETEALATTGALLVHLATAKLTPAAARTPSFRSRGFDGDDSPWIVDGQWCALALETRGRSERLVVRRATLDGKALPSVALGADATVTVRRSRDGSVLALFGSGAPRARLVQLPSGARIGEIAAADLSGEFGAVDGMLFVEEPSVGSGATVTPLQLRAIDLKSGAVRWTHPLQTPVWQPPRP